MSERPTAEAETATVCNEAGADVDAALAALAPRPAFPPSGKRGERRRIVVILGMHRSGTSLLGHMLHYLGVDMADEADHASVKNPGGFWERPQLVALHDEILAAIGRPVDSPLHSLPFPAGWWREKRVQALKKKLRAFVQAELAGCPGLWGFKDPRTCRLLPLWREIFDELDLQPSYVWAVRYPGESSASMAAKNPGVRPMTPPQAEVTWLAYNLDVMRYAPEARMAVVDYADWFLDPVRIAKDLATSLALSPLLDDSELADATRSIVNDDFRNEEKGKGQAIAKIALAERLFEEIVRPSEDGGERLGRFAAVLDVVFRAIAPFVELQAELPNLRTQLRDAKKAGADISVKYEDLRRQAEVQARALADAQAQAARLAPMAAEQETTAAELLDLARRLRKFTRVLESPKPEYVAKVGEIAARLEQLGRSKATVK